MTRAASGSKSRVHAALRLGQSAVPENRPGAGGMVGADVVARATPDGYTILLTDPALVTNLTLQSDAPYDLKALQAVSIVGSSPALIVASLTLPVKTFPELIAYAKANPGKLNFASCVYRKLDSAILMVKSTQYGP